MTDSVFVIYLAAEYGWPTFDVYTARLNGVFDTLEDAEVFLLDYCADDAASENTYTYSIVEYVLPPF